MANLTALGTPSKTVFLNDPDSHGLHIAFDVKAGDIIKKGMPVKLTGDDEIGVVIGDGTDNHAIIGYAIQNGVGGDQVTVAVRGYAVVWAASKTANAVGPVFYTGLDSVDPLYSNYEDTGVSAANTNGWAIDSSVTAHEMIRVILK